MRKIVLPVLLFAAALVSVAGAGMAFGESDSSGASPASFAEPSIMPDSIFWGIKDELESISLALTFDPASKADRGLKIAEERLAEFRSMAEEGNIRAAEKAKQSHDKYIEKVMAAASNIRYENKTEEIERQIEIEREVEDMEAFSEETADRIRIKIETSGNLTAEQKALIDSLIASMQNRTGSLKIEIEQHKEKIKIEIKQGTNKSETEIEHEIEDIEQRHNLTSEKTIEKAREEINDAKEEIATLEAKIAASNITDNAVLTLRDNAKAKIAEAESAYNSTRFGEARGLANAAGELAENAKEKIEKMAENEEKEHDDGNKPRNETEDDNHSRVCIQVITPAKNDASGECREFPTPCDVPKDWEKVGQCPAGHEQSEETKSVWIEGAFDLFTETRQNEKVCKEKNISMVPGGCALQNISYDRNYVTELEDKALETGGCWEKVVHRFLAIKKGETEIRAIGTCDDYNKVYEIKIKG